MLNSRVTPRKSFQLPWQNLLRGSRESFREERTAELQQLLAREAALQQEIKDLLRRQSAQAEEFDHRLLNSIQMIVSLLSAQSRIASPEASAQLTIALNRIIAFGHVHRQLHLLDHQEQVEFKQYLERLCEDLSGLIFSDSSADTIVVQGTSCKIPTSLGSLSVSSSAS